MGGKPRYNRYVVLLFGLLAAKIQKKQTMTNKRKKKKHIFSSQIIHTREYQQAAIPQLPQKHCGTQDMKSSSLTCRNKLYSKRNLVPKNNRTKTTFLPPSPSAPFRQAGQRT